MPIKKISSISDLLSNLQEDMKEYDKPIWFRGHSDEKWKLVPSIFRQDTHSEIVSLRKFQQDAPLLINPRPANSWEWLFIMRHYDVPTRLLDWTESPLVATYFAIHQHPDSDGALWILRPLKLNSREGRVIGDKHTEQESSLPWVEDEDLDIFNPENYSREHTRTFANPIAFLAPRNTPRMQSQLSVFTINYHDSTPMEDANSNDYLWKYLIPKDAKKTILKELQLLKINKFQLYPELDKIIDESTGEKNG